MIRISVEEILKHDFLKPEKEGLECEALPVIQEDCHEFTVKMAYLKRRKKIEKKRKKSKMNGMAGNLMRHQKYGNIKTLKGSDIRTKLCR